VQPFTYHRPLALTDALSRLAEPRAVPMGGGTDLLVFLKEGLGAPEAVVDLRSIAGYATIELANDGGARIGAGARLSDLAAHPELRERFRALTEACASVGTTALRHMGTLGGNLCQRPRCWYFRRGISCLKSGGDSCWAAEEENRYHAILEGGPCWIVHPSDPAVALTALDAVVVVSGGAGPAERRVPIGEFFVLPSERLDRETVLDVGEVVTAVEIPPASAGGWQRYSKLMQRGSWDFALASLAAVRRVDGSIRLVMGGVAPRPWRVPLSIEEDVAGGGLDPHDVATLADRALYDARPLAKNGYKIDMAAALLRRSIAELGRVAGT
jgi:xanthine dehydrogenase YagS FAD-binding subunit